MLGLVYVLKLWSKLKLRSTNINLFNFYLHVYTEVNSHDSIFLPCPCLAPQNSGNLELVNRSRLLWLYFAPWHGHDGTGRLDILVTGDRDSDSLLWRSVFSDLVCGQDRPFVVMGGEVSSDHSSIEVIIQYVEVGMSDKTIY